MPPVCGVGSGRTVTVLTNQRPNLQLGHGCPRGCDELGNQNAKRFDSLQSGVLSQRPLLLVQALAAPIPEPASLWLLGAGVAGVAGVGGIAKFAAPGALCRLRPGPKRASSAPP